MSAADKLRALDGRLGAYPLTMGATDWTWQSLADLRNALPEIIVVVKAAESHDIPHRNNCPACGCPQTDALRDSLAALTAKLGATR